MSRPLVIDLCCGLGGWTHGFLAEGWDAIGFDIERHQYGEKRYPAQLVLQDIRTLDGRQFRNADMIVASPPCQAYSYMAMPWDRAKREIRWQKWERDSPFGDFHLNDLFDACFRIAREAGVPIVVENVKGAQPWVGRAAWHYGSYYLWGDVPALMPQTLHRKVPGMNFHEFEKTGQGRSFQSAAVDSIKNAGTAGGSWFNISHGERIPGNQRGAPQRGDGLKTVGHANIRDGHTHTRHLTNQRESDAVKGMSGLRGFSHPSGNGGRDLGGPNDPRRFSSKSTSRKAASAMIAEIPFDLAQWIARCFKPDRSATA
jgi:hypothetical protein